MSTTTGAKDKIAQIIAARDPLFKEFQRRRSALQRVSVALQKLEAHRQRIEQTGSPLMKKSMVDLDVKTLKDKVDETYHKLAKPEARFRRKTLNIGVLGYARQGKSTFLRSVSGLRDDVIPTGSQGACTGTRSLIVHDSNPNSEGATIIFYTESEFLEEVIVPYYDMLQLERYGKYRPYSLDDFARARLPGTLDVTSAPSGNGSLADMYKQGKQVLQGVYAELFLYFQHLKDYRPFLDQPARQRPLSEVRFYTAQQDMGGNPLYTYLAVKEAVIRNNFGSLDVEQVGLLDIPGLGGLRIADQQRFVKALERDIDIALLVNKPSPDGADLSTADLALYGLVDVAFEGLSLKESAFAIVNHRFAKDPKDDNITNCRRIQAQIQGQRLVQECYVVDCSDKTRTKEDVLLPILEYLKSHMTQYNGHPISQQDKTYVSFWDAQYAQLSKEIHDFIKKMPSSSSPSSSSSEDTETEALFISYFEPLWQELQMALEGSSVSIKNQSGSANNTFIKYFQQKIGACEKDTGIGTVTSIQKDAGGENRYVKVFSEQIDHMRTYFEGQFGDIDDQLKEHVRTVKSQVARVFLETGKLNLVYPGLPPDEFFQRISKEPALATRGPRLPTAFKNFDEMDIHFNGYLQTLIHGGFLSIMYPDTAIMRYLISDYVSPRLARLHKEFHLDAQDWWQLTNIILTFIIIHVTQPNPLLALVNDIDALLQIDELAKHKLVEAIKSLFLAETQVEFSVFTPEQIKAALHTAHRDTLNMIKQNLETFYSLPGKATVAAIQNFVDQILRSKGIEEDWRLFYRAHKSTIWSAEFGRIARWQADQGQWRIHIGELEQAANQL